VGWKTELASATGRFTTYQLSTSPSSTIKLIRVGVSLTNDLVGYLATKLYALVVTTRGTHVVVIRESGGLFTLGLGGNFWLGNVWGVNGRHGFICKWSWIPELHRTASVYETEESLSILIQHGAP